MTCLCAILNAIYITQLPQSTHPPPTFYSSRPAVVPARAPAACQNRVLRGPAGQSADGPSPLAGQDGAGHLLLLRRLLVERCPGRRHQSTHQCLSPPAQCTTRSFSVPLTRTLTLTHARTHARNYDGVIQVTAVDSSKPALDTADKNIRLNGFDHVVTTVKSDASTSSHSSFSLSIFSCASLPLSSPSKATPVRGYFSFYHYRLSLSVSLSRALLCVHLPPSPSPPCSPLPHPPSPSPSPSLLPLASRVHEAAGRGGRAVRRGHLRPPQTRAHPQLPRQRCI